MIRLVRSAAVFLICLPLAADHMTAVRQPVEILRDRWGVPHIYAKNTGDLFFAQGFITAKDRLFQIDLWRRIGTGKLAEVLGPTALPRDRIARLVRFRGNWDEEWRSYAPDAREIATAFTDGINAYIHSLNGKKPLEFELAGYDPGLWAPEDVTARVAGLLMTGNMTREVQRAIDVTRFGLDTVQKLMPPDPFRALDPPPGINLSTITRAIVHDYVGATGPVTFPGEQGSNNWVVDGTMSVTGRPLLANDPHRPVQIPSLRKTVHLIAPGWNVIGAGEPALPGIALGHNQSIAFGFTIVGIDQQDLYVEKLNPQNPGEYLYRGEWKKLDIERQPVSVKGRADLEQIELRYTIHGPVIYEDRAKNCAYALRWTGSEPGGAGYLAALSVARAANWSEFRSGVARYKIPSENMVYADRAGNIGWIAAGLAPIRKNWSGLFPVPGDSGDYEWSGYLGIDDLPQAFNPPRHFIATANHNILPEGYTKQLSYEWAAPARHNRIVEMLSAHKKFAIRDFEQMQQDVTSLTAARFVRLLPAGSPLAGWDAQLRVDSPKALLYEVWASTLPAAVFGPELGSRVTLQRTLEELEAHPNPQAIERAYQAAQPLMTGMQTWGDLHKIFFRHPLKTAKWNRGPVSRPGDSTTVNATSGPRFYQTSGASYREIIDVSNWDRSVMTNVPGESGDPTSKHYDDLIEDWASGQYHPMPFTRKTVELATEERLTLLPHAATGSRP
ncbi:MAG: penicillin acylase family protein [Bryobacteraceae bacterium]